MARTKQTARKSTEGKVPRAPLSGSVKKDTDAWEKFRDPRNWRPRGCFHGTVQPVDASVATVDKNALKNKIL